MPPEDVKTARITGFMHRISQVIVDNFSEFWRTTAWRAPQAESIGLVGSDSFPRGFPAICVRSKRWGLESVQNGF